MKKIVYIISVLLIFAAAQAFAEIPGKVPSLTTSKQKRLQSSVVSSVQEKEEHPGVPAVPFNLHATVRSSKQIDLAWGYGRSTEDGFVLERRTETEGEYKVVAAISQGSLRYEDLRVYPNTTYLYRVRAFNRDGYSEASAEIQATTPPQLLPSAPNNVSAQIIEGVTNDECKGPHVLIQWYDTSNNEDGFKVERKREGEGVFTEIGRAKRNEKALIPSGCAVWGTSYYRVKAFNSYGDSEESPICSAVR
ncbi:MAG TPA: fibronectin type III domain-containing protein [Candidatus Omnitrophota bacterium]|nr:fibronectin type III domain-containing protein [Candidatus Omnitrophota bacterium]